MKKTCLMLWSLLGSAWIQGKALAINEEKPSIQFNLMENKSDNTFRALMNFTNQSQTVYQEWILHFNFVRPIIKLSGAELLQDNNRNGDFFSIKAPDKATRLEPGQTVSMEILGKWFLKHDTDAPAGFFISYRDETGQSRIQKLQSLSHIQDSQEPIASLDKTTRKQSPLGLTIIPKPVEGQLLNTRPFTLSPRTQIVVDKRAHGAAEAAAFFVEALGTKLSVVDKSGAQQTQIHFKATSVGKPEQYALHIDTRKIEIIAADAAGFHYAVQSLRQLLPAAYFQMQPPPLKALTLPALQIKDYPRYEWRGLHLDVARNFHGPADIKRLLDLMALHKLNRFHWHLTDDEGWRIAIGAYPELTEIGAYRGYGLPLAPSLGSGPDRSGGFYSRDEIREIVAYAQKRQITIIPEIDMPGHARALIKSLPQLKDASDQSTYESVQAYNDNVLSPCIPATFEVIDHILKEVSNMFPGPWVHVGGDEVPEGVWNPERSHHCKALMAREGLKNKLEIENFFFKKIKASLDKYGKQMAGWEEIASGPGFPDRKVLTFAWKSSQEGERLAKAGYPVVMNPADHLYFDLAYSEDPREPGYYWAGTIDTKKVYSFPGAAADLKTVLGLQGNLWSETIRNRQELDYRAFPRVVALAEIAWTAAKLQSWNDFSQRLESAHLPRLDAYGVQYRIAPGLGKLTNEALSPKSFSSRP